MRQSTSIFAIAVLLLALATVSAQSKKDAPAPSGLALEVTYYRDLPPGYLQVPPEGSKPVGAWFGRFRHLPSVESGKAVQAVNIVSRKEAGGVKVTVSVFFGKYHEEELPVASYLLQENEHITVDDLRRFGLEAFEITLIRAPAMTTVLPGVINRTRSVGVVRVDPNNSTLPSYTLSVRNNSDKDILAIDIDVVVGESKRLLGLQQSLDGLTLVKAGDTLQVRVPAAKDTLTTRHGYTPETTPYQSILIAAAVFDDFTSEGDTSVVEKISGRRAGLRMGLTQAVLLLEGFQSQDGEDAALALERIKSRASSLLNEEVRPDLVRSLVESLPGVNRDVDGAAHSTFLFGLRYAKKRLVEEIAEFDKSRKGELDQEAFQAWLNEITARYKTWLSKL
jgi:hypothetical protein